MSSNLYYPSAYFDRQRTWKFIDWTSTKDTDWCKFNIDMDFGTYEYPGTTLNISFSKYGIRLKLGVWSTNHSPTQEVSKQIGVSLLSTVIMFKTGKITDDGFGTSLKFFDIPWLNFMFNKITIFNPNLTPHWIRHEEDYVIMEYLQVMDEEVEAVTYQFLDSYDEELITVRCICVQREWTRGVGWCKWLRYVTKPLIYRTLDLRYDKPVGARKTSWKGGTIAEDFNMLDNETIACAYTRFCAANGHTPV